MLSEIRFKDLHEGPNTGHSPQRRKDCSVCFQTSTGASDEMKNDFKSTGLCVVFGV